MSESKSGALLERGCRSMVQRRLSRSRERRKQIQGIQTRWSMYRQKTRQGSTNQHRSGEPKGYQHLPSRRSPGRYLPAPHVVRHASSTIQNFSGVPRLGGFALSMDRFVPSFRSKVVHRPRDVHPVQSVGNSIYPRVHGGKSRDFVLVADSGRGRRSGSTVRQQTGFPWRENSPLGTSKTQKRATPRDTEQRKSENSIPSRALHRAVVRVHLISGHGIRTVWCSHGGHPVGIVPRAARSNPPAG